MTKHAQCRLLHLHSAVDRHMIHDHALFQPAHGYWITLHRTAQHAHKQSLVISCNRPDMSWIRCTHACLYRITTAGSTHTHIERPWAGGTLRPWYKSLLRNIQLSSVDLPRPVSPTSTRHTAGLDYCNSFTHANNKQITSLDVSFKW